MSFFSFIGIYLVIWWTVLFAILPLGTTTYAEAGLDISDGGDPGAPVDPKLKKKVFTTTWVSLVIFVIGYLALSFHLVPFPNLPQN